MTQQHKAFFVLSILLLTVIAIGMAICIPTTNKTHITYSANEQEKKVEMTVSPNRPIESAFTKMVIIDSDFGNSMIGINTDNPGAYHIQGTKFHDNVIDINSTSPPKQ